MKLNLLFLLFLGLLTACNGDLCEGSDWKTSQGVCVFTNGFDVDKDKLSYVIDVVEDVVSSRHPKKYPKNRLNDVYDSVSVSFEEDLGDKIGGYCRYEYGPFVRDIYEVVSEFTLNKDELPWHYVWILPHEVMHIFLLDISSDDSHKKGWHVDAKFSDEENFHSMQYEIYLKLRCDLEDRCE